MFKMTDSTEDNSIKDIRSIEAGKWYKGNASDVGLYTRSGRTKNILFMDFDGDIREYPDIKSNVFTEVSLEITIRSIV
jgi:hypothetical protein